MNGGARIKVCLVLGMMAMVMPAFSQVQGVRAGGTFSFKGSGISVLLDGPGNTSRYRIFVDFTDLLNGSTRQCGYQADYALLYSLTRWDLADGLVVRPYVGPGMQVGYIRDWRKSRGVTLGVTAAAGFRLDFRRNVCLDFGLTFEAGFHLEAHSRYDTRLTFYRNGLFRAPVPELGLLYRF